MRHRKQIYYYDLARIEQGRDALSPAEQDVQERLAVEGEEQLVAKLDLEAALNVLTPRQKTCVVLCAEGYTEREIAAELRLSRGNVHAYLDAARKKLKKILAP